MDKFEISASKFNVNSKLLKEFDKALRFFKNKEEVKRTAQVTSMIDNLLIIITPLAEHLKGNLSDSTTISEHNLVEILKAQHEKGWVSYKKEIERVHKKLQAEKVSLSKEDLKILNDIADALDAECANLFRKMRV